MNGKTSKTSPKSPSPVGKLAPVPVRLDEHHVAQLETLSNKTGLPKGAIVRIGLNYFLPKFLSGEINILECGKK